MFHHSVESSQGIKVIKPVVAYDVMTEDHVKEAIRVAKKRVVVKSGYKNPIIEKLGFTISRQNQKRHFFYGVIEIEGHTDNVPMSGSKYSNNDELSSGRALSVFYFLKENTTLDITKIKHSGRGEYDPVADNSTEEGRAKNRRVVIKIYNSLSSY